MPLWIVAVLVVAVHLTTNLGAYRDVGLLSDDRYSVGLAFLSQPLSWPDLLYQTFLEPRAADLPVALYRPVLQLSYAFEYGWFGVAAPCYHVTNSVLHCATSLLWFLFVRRLAGSSLAATAAAILFAGLPGHGESTHWIASRANLLSAMFATAALLAWVMRDGGRRRSWTATAVAATVLALGCKESAVMLVPWLTILSWLQDEPGPRRWSRPLRVLWQCTPVLLAVAAWSLLRYSVLHTFGAGRDAPWHLDASAPLAWLQAYWERLQLLVAPVHRDFTSAAFGPALWLLHGGLIALACSGARRGHGRRACWFGLLALAVGCLGILGLTLDADHLANSRHLYDPGLPLAALLGLGIASLPKHLAWPALALVAAVHGLVLDGNRDGWLRGGRLRTRLEAEAHAAAAAGALPLVVFDAPSVYHGAFVYLGDITAFLPPFAPAAVAGRGTVYPDMEWPGTLEHLARAAAARAAPPSAALFAVGWSDGSLLPLTVDARYPLPIGADATIRYARAGRARPFVGSDLPVQILAATPVPLACTPRASAGARRWTGTPATLDPRQAPVLQCWLPLPADLEPGVPVQVELEVAGAGEPRVLPLGEVVPAAWTTRP